MTEAEATTSTTIFAAMLSGGIVWHVVPIGPNWLILTALCTLLVVRIFVSVFQFGLSYLESIARTTQHREVSRD